MTEQIDRENLSARAQRCCDFEPDFCWQAVQQRTGVPRPQGAKVFSRCARITWSLCNRLGAARRLL